jgi:hypothetical protein
MKPKEYVRKYNLEQATSLPPGFIEEFAGEFLGNISVLNEKGGFSLERFNVCVTQVKQKFDGIKFKSKVTTEAFTKAWNYFYATTVVKARDAFFGDIMKARKDAYEKRKKEREEWDSWEQESFFDDRMGFLWRLLMSSSIPSESFVVLGIPHTSTVPEIKSAFLKLSQTHHPDKGGDHDTFCALVTAKDKCMAYAQKG